MFGDQAAEIFGRQRIGKDRPLDFVAPFLAQEGQLGLVFRALGDDPQIKALGDGNDRRRQLGAIARLVHTDGSAMTVNVEYNQLGPLLVCVPQSAGPCVRGGTVC